MGGTHLFTLKPNWMQQKVGLTPSNYFHEVFSCQYCIDFQNNIYCRKSMESVTTLFLLLFLMRVQLCFISVMSLDTCLCKIIAQHSGKLWQHYNISLWKAIMVCGQFDFTPHYFLFAWDREPIRRLLKTQNRNQETTKRGILIDICWSHPREVGEDRYPDQAQSQIEKTVLQQPGCAIIWYNLALVIARPHINVFSLVYLIIMFVFALVYRVLSLYYSNHSGH